MTKSIGFAVVFLAASTALLAVPNVPEIDATTGSSAVALIAGAMLVVRGRRAK